MVAIAVLLATVGGAIAYGGRRARARDVEEWAIGGRRLGLLIFWFVNAGEIYTTFAVLGISGFAWAYGAPAYLALTSVSLASAFGYWLTPRIWSAGRRHGLVTQADFFALSYDAEWLGVVVALAGLFATVVYVEVQLTALSLVLQLTVGHAVGAAPCVVAAAVLMLAFVFLAGLRSAAFAAGVKDVLMIALVIALSFSAAGHVGAASIADLFRRAEQLRPGLGAFPGADPAAGLTTGWFITSALNVAASTWFFPHMFQLSYAASGERALRQNAIWQPIYSLSYFFIILLGFAVIVAGTDVPGGNPNAALLQFVASRYPAWLVGLLAGTASLLALVPGSVLLMTAGTIFARNIVRPAMGERDPRTTLLISRLAMIGFAGCAVYLTLGASGSIVKIGLSAYASIGMLAPGGVLALIWARAQALGVLAGLVVGYLALLHPAAIAFWHAALPGWEPGLAALILNSATVVLVSLLVSPLRAPPSGAATA